MPTKEYIREYRKKRKQLALDMLGGKCVVCGTEDNLHFDHITPENKVNEISSMFTSNINVFIDEVKKCQLLCSDCHIEKSINEGDYLINRKSWEHGVSGYINQKCRCEICKEQYRVFRSDRWKNEGR